MERGGVEWRGSLGKSVSPHLATTNVHFQHGRQGELLPPRHRSAGEVGEGHPRRNA